MQTATMIASALTLAAVLLPVTGFAQLIIGAIFGRNLGVSFSALLGSLGIWFTIDWLWRRFEGGHITLVTLALCLVLVAVKWLLEQRAEDHSKPWALPTEATAIVLLAAYLFFSMESPRLY